MGEVKQGKMTRGIFTPLLLIAITTLSLIPIPDVPELGDVPFFDKWVHFVMYGALTIAMWMDWWRHGRWAMPQRAFIVISFVFPSVWGGLMELAQAYLTTCRSGDWIDFYADCFGALLGVIISYSTWKIKEKTSAAS